MEGRVEQGKKWMESQLADTGGLPAGDLLHQMDDWSQFQAGEKNQVPVGGSED